jgi:hypothetical protein
LVVGNSGNGYLTNSGGQLTTRSLIVGKNAGTTGTVVLAGGTTTVSSNLVVGDCAAGAIGVVSVNGGTLYVTNATHTAFIDVRAGTITVSTGGLVITDALIVTNPCGRFIQSGGTTIYSRLNLDPMMDADGDGLPNGWEQRYVLNPFSPSGNDGAAADPDGDGMSNLQEFLAGTDPTNSASSFRITAVAQEDNNLRITWITGLGKTNILQRAISASGSLTNSFTNVFTVTNTVTSVTNYLDVGALTNWPARYYRVRLAQ